MYGNAIDDIAYQAETELFGRIMSLKCPTFEEKYCIFDREQMSSKVRLQLLRTAMICTPKRDAQGSMPSEPPASCTLIPSKWASMDAPV